MDDRITAEVAQCGTCQGKGWTQARRESGRLDMREPREDCTACEGSGRADAAAPVEAAEG